jgi:two-component system alkaline phosphatase synthesis response regulator PhoP
MIYYVEDDESYRDLVIYSLNSFGLEAYGFPDAQSFFAACEQSQPQLILLDILLPDVDGISILFRIKSNAETSDIPTVLMSVKSAEFEGIMGLESGADLYIAKPVGMMELVSRIRALLRRAPHAKSGPVAGKGFKGAH